MLIERFDDIFKRIGNLERCLARMEAEGKVVTEQPAASLDGPADASVQQLSVPCLTPGASATQNRLEKELIDKGFSAFRFVRAPPDYYDRVSVEHFGPTTTCEPEHCFLCPGPQPLDYRMACIGAFSTEHLCKSVVMENTRAHQSVDGWSNPLNSKYYVVIVQVVLL